MLEITMSCAMCGNEKNLGFIKVNGPNGLAAIIENAGWIWQHNDDYLDVYCSERCAA